MGMCCKGLSPIFSPLPSKCTRPTGWQPSRHEELRGRMVVEGKETDEAVFCIAASFAFPFEGLLRAARYMCASNLLRLSADESLPG